MTLSLACLRDLIPGLDPCKTPQPNWINDWCVGGCAAMHSHTQKTISVQLSQVEPHHVLRERGWLCTDNLTHTSGPRLLYCWDTNLQCLLVCLFFCETGSLVAQTGLELIMWQRTILNFWSFCFFLPGTGITVLSLLESQMLSENPKGIYAK